MGVPIWDPFCRVRKQLSLSDGTAIFAPSLPTSHRVPSIPCENFETATPTLSVLPLHFLPPNKLEEPFGNAPRGTRVDRTGTG